MNLFHGQILIVIILGQSKWLITHQTGKLKLNSHPQEQISPSLLCHCIIRQISLALLILQYNIYGVRRERKWWFFSGVLRRKLLIWYKFNVSSRCDRIEIYCCPQQWSGCWWSYGFPPTLSTWSSHRAQRCILMDQKHSGIVVSPKPIPHTGV